MEKNLNKENSSFRDPAGYIYYENNNIYRKIFPCYFDEYNHFMKSGLYKVLLDKKMIIPHKEIKKTKDYILLEVDKVPFISYPYEWCFEQLKDSALLTLEINKIALEYGMVLKDASGYNIQYFNGMPTFIDTLSFSFYEENTPWGAYGQFCRHYIAPLLLMKYVDERMACLLKDYIDGVPIDMANAILKGRGGFTTKQHITWHSKAISNYSDSNKEIKKIEMPKIRLIQMLDMITRQINKLSKVEKESEWGDYYNHTNYDEVSDKAKIKLVESYLNKIPTNKEDILFDIGANDGKYSRIASNKDIYVVSYDIDYNCIRHNYNQIKTNKEKNILPLYLDCTNPTPSIGFNTTERKSLNDRGNARGVMALALIHHIAISNNVPFYEIANWFSNLGEYLIIEFVPKEDSQVQKLLRTRRDIFDWYDEENFEKDFYKYFKIIEKQKIKNSKRTLYLLKRNLDVK